MNAKRILSLVITICMMLTLMSFPVMAATTGTTADGLGYSIENGEVTITGYSGSATSVTIPSTISGCPVTVIGNAFSQCDYVYSIVIPNGVTTIKGVAFYNCSHLLSITIPSSLTSIGNLAFSYCSSLTDVYYTGTKTEKDAIAIGNNPELTNATWHFVLCEENGHTYDNASDTMCNVCDTEREIPIPDGLKYGISNNEAVFITDYTGSAKTIAIPATIEGYPVTKITDQAFCYSLTLTSITIPDSVTSIGDMAFVYCTSLTSITVDADNQYYSSQDGVLFNKDKTTLIQYPIGKTATSYTIPDSVTTIGMYAFDGCSKLTSITIPDSVTTIDNGAFSGCTALTSVTIPDSVTTIGRAAFYGCSSLTSVTIPNSVTTINNYAFSNCSSLTDVYYNGTKAQKDAISIYSENTYLTDATWHCAECDKNGHTYDNDCDPDCNVCDATREVGGHVYDNSSDDTCNSCGYKRSSADCVLTVGKRETFLLHLDTSKGVTISEEKGILEIGDTVVGDGFVAFYLTALPEATGKDTTVKVKTIDGKTLCSFTVGVEGVPTDNAPTFVVSNATSKVGKTFTVEVSLKNNPGITSLRLEAGYDSSVLELIGVEGKDFASPSFGPTTKNPIIINWEDVLNPNNTTDGTVAVLTFKVKETAYEGDTKISITYDPEDVYDENYDNVSFAVEEGTITIIEYLSGDVNSDGVVNNKDLGILRQFLNNWDVTVDERAADVTGDGRVNNKDLGILRQYLNGWDVELK